MIQFRLPVRPCSLRHVAAWMLRAIRRWCPLPVVLLCVGCGPVTPAHRSHSTTIATMPVQAGPDTQAGRAQVLQRAQANGWIYQIDVAGLQPVLIVRDEFQTLPRADQLRLVQLAHAYAWRLPHGDNGQRGQKTVLRTIDGKAVGYYTHARGLQP